MASTRFSALTDGGPTDATADWVIDDVIDNGGTNGLQIFVDGLLGLLMAVLSLMTVLGNALVIYAVRTDRKLQTVGVRRLCFKFLIAAANHRELWKRL